jgi:hypothetical protein
MSINNISAIQVDNTNSFHLVSAKKRKKRKDKDDKNEEEEDEQQQEDPNNQTSAAGDGKQANNWVQQVRHPLGNLWPAKHSTPHQQQKWHESTGETATKLHTTRHYSIDASSAKSIKNYNAVLHQAQQVALSQN